MMDGGSILTNNLSLLVVMDFKKDNRMICHSIENNFYCLRDNF